MALFNITGAPPKGTGLIEGRLNPCPNDSNACVCSQYREHATFMGRHYVQPLSFAGDPGDAMTRVLAMLMQRDLCKVVTNTPTYIHAEFRSKTLGLVDDVEFLLSDAQKVIHIRSASRLPIPDLGANRARVVELREAFDEADE